MKRIIYTFILVILSFTGGNVWAQAPEAFQYQAVVRDTEGNIRANEDVTLTISILEGSANGAILYEESHDVTTNAMGLVDLMIGKGSTGDDFTAINWSEGAWFIQVSVDGNVMGTSQLLSVPFAKYADHAGNTFSGSYNDLSDIPVQLDTDSTDDFSGSFPDLNGIPQHLDTDSTNDFSGDYADLSNKPDLEAKLDSSATLGWDKDTTDDFSGDYDDLIDRPKYISDIKLVADGRPIRRVGEPENPDDAATKAYVDTSSGGSWSLKGNAAIDTSIHFIGTTNEQPLVFKVNNTERMRLDTGGTLVMSPSGNSIFIGAEAGSSDDGTNNRNIFLGPLAGSNNTSGYLNTAVGYGALHSNISGSSNIAVGYEALHNNESGVANIAIGYQSLYYNTTGRSNHAYGFNSLASNTTGIYNSAFGSASLYSNTEGQNNTAYGRSSMNQNETGSGNTAVGSRAMLRNVDGDYNTAVGYRAGQSSGYESLNNTGAFGYNADVTASNSIRIGNSSITQIGGAVGWSNLSDGRFKTQVKPNVPGLDFIMRLEPVTFRWDLDALDRFHGQDQSRGVKEDSPAMKKARAEKEQKVYTGFVAQQVEEAAKEIDFDFSGIREPANKNSTYNLSYAEFVVPLVKAIQQQQKTIENQQKMIEELNEKINQLQ
jgi:hypothetical protein